MQTPLVVSLLRHLAAGQDADAAIFTWRPTSHRPEEFRWVLDGGLGPLLLRTCERQGVELPPHWRDAMVEADLMARLAHGNRVATLLGVLDACEAAGCRGTLLKGMSVSEQFYPEPHLRPMGDVDVLLPEDRYAAVERGCLARGLDVLLAYDEPSRMHHGPALHDAARNVVVELHTALFPADSQLVAGRSFSRETVMRHQVDSAFRGRPVLRLDAEFQLVYIASSWFNDLTVNGVDPSFLPSLFDAVLLMARHQRTLDWPAVLDCVDNRFARASTLALLTYLPRLGLEPAPRAVLNRLAVRPRLDGPPQLRALHWMLDRHLLGARPWRAVVPMPVPGRYSLAYQFEKRVLRRLGRGSP